MSTYGYFCIPMLVKLPQRDDKLYEEVFDGIIEPHYRPPIVQPTATATKTADTVFLLLMRSGSVRYGKTRHSGLLSVLYVLLLLLLLLLLLADSHEHITTKWFPTEVQWKNQNWISTNPQETAMIAEKELQKGLPWSHRRVTPINSTPFKSKWNPGKNPREWYIFTRVTKRAID